MMLNHGSLCSFKVGVKLHRWGGGGGGDGVGGGGGRWQSRVTGRW